MTTDGKAPTPRQRFWEKSVWISRFVLVFAFMDFGVLGFTYVSEPAIMSWNYGINVVTQTAMSSMRVAFGGYPLGIAAVAVFCMLATRRLLTGIAVVCTIGVVTTLVRILGIEVDGAESRNMLMLRREAFSTIIYMAGLAVEWRRRALTDPPPP